ncbi:prolyl-tRNA synthetase [Patescibacteria group bacterium]|nr:prolyl-tRNA synthetase [Patescibacteria group bacterium]MBU1500990.1 prolyl-tRNA synthetase [Patescibacteria group bacterium]MBU2080620.1 prolyl-tRNA synthetase [Patescibacteria group bacterium]MBU2124305.1 prolyl-tRNA synthetase [Patescibacteria group bacterium]MBU2194431.1 prolyl-tRNA synthetase [Patescibacteria group bacterium]
MRQSSLFTKTRREAPKDELAKNAQLLIRAGYVHKEMAGVYAYLPLGLKVVERIKAIVREEMEAIGGNELLMTSLQSKELWEKTDRWDDKNVDVWFKSVLKNGSEVGFGWSHEEPITELMTEYLASYRDLPAYVYQFQTKLRNELRAKSGIMRGREFVMKDMYSYTTDEEAHLKFYNAAIQAYHNVFMHVGLGELTYLTFASGGAFTQFSHEFQTVSEAGEDTIYVHKKKRLAVNKEVLTPEVLEKLDVKREELVEEKAIEVGNIFSFGSIKSEQLGLKYKDEEGTEKPVILGSYGIGITRLMGTIVESFADEKGIVWPEAVAPFAYHLVSLAGNNGDVAAYAESLYEELTDAGKSVLYDDRDVRAGEKFADSDLMGLPWRIVVGKDTLSSGQLELVHRKTGETTHLTRSELLAR